ncbi:hypothetical protein [Georgenia faecalis]|uniref:hypothetical protein n=1 Tax=Georgenia faecalis TaxID=2483799 RepID=UPI000FD9F7D7|nr:hypothetical protein [Georgenia faecalis]
MSTDHPTDEGEQMSRTRKIKEIETEKLRQQAVDLGHLLTEQASKAGATATSLAEQGKMWATSVAAPTIDKAWRDGVKVAAPKIEAAADKARPAVDSVHGRIVDDYLPRLHKAMQDAARAASGEPAAPVKAPRSHGAVKTVGWILVGTAAAGTGYLLWRRTQPVDDPWAEEYWDDTTVATTVPAEDLATDEGSDLSGTDEVITAVEVTEVDAELPTDTRGDETGEGSAAR